MLYDPSKADASWPPRFLTSAPAKGNRATRRGYRARGRRFIESGNRRAAIRALASARMYMTSVVLSIAKAAEACGSNVSYVADAVALLTAEDDQLRAAVLDGRVSLSAAAKAMKPL